MGMLKKIFKMAYQLTLAMPVLLCWGLGEDMDVRIIISGYMSPVSRFKQKKFSNLVKKILFSYRKH